MSKIPSICMRNFFRSERSVAKSSTWFCLERMRFKSVRGNMSHSRSMRLPIAVRVKSTHSSRLNCDEPSRRFEHTSRFLKDESSIIT